jgi:hypothetical protein
MKHKVPGKIRGKSTSIPGIFDFLLKDNESKNNSTPQFELWNQDLKGRVIFGN